MIDVNGYPVQFFNTYTTIPAAQKSGLLGFPFFSGFKICTLDFDRMNFSGEGYRLRKSYSELMNSGDMIGLDIEYERISKTTDEMGKWLTNASLEMMKNKPESCIQYTDSLLGKYQQELGGDIYKISLLSTFPHFIQVEQKYGNMVKGMMAAKMSHSKAGVSKAAKGAVTEGDVPRAGKGTMTDRQFESHEAKTSQDSAASNSVNGSSHVTKTSSNHQSAKAQADMESRKGTAAQSGMFRQLTGGLESVITAIVEAMPSNVQLYTGALVSDIRYVDGVYAIDVAKSCNDSCGCQSTAEHVIISTPPATYTQWFKDDAGFDFLRSMEQSSCAIAIMSFDKSNFDGDLKGSGLLITRNTNTPLTACTILNQKWPQTTPDDKVVLRVFIGKPGNDVVERLSEEELSELAVKEIQHIMGFSVKPEWVRINRLIHCMPQYNVGHRAGIKAVREHVAEHYPNLHLIGTPFDGIGIPDGVKQAKELVEKLVNDK